MSSQKNSQFDGSVQGVSYNQNKPPTYAGSVKSASKISRIQSAHPSGRTASIPLSDLMRMKEQMTNENYNLEIENRQKDKRQLLERSQERVQNWPNTLQALRKKKGDAKYERFKVDEEERRRIDVEEKILFQAERKIALQKANEQMYQQQDKVKKFNQKLLLSDALQEMDEQKLIKVQLKQLDDVREIIFIEQFKEQQRLAFEEEERKQKLLAQKKQYNALVLKEQKDIMRDNFIKTIQQEKIEGEIIKDRAKEQLQFEKDDEKKKRDLEQQNQQYIRYHNEYQKQQKELLKQKIIEEDKQIQKHAELKQKVNEMRKIQEQMRFQAKQEEKQKLVEAQTKRMQNVTDQQNYILNKQIKEAQIKEEQNELIKKQRIEAMKERIDESYNLNMKIKRIQSAKAKTETIEYEEQCQERSNKILQKELKDKQDRQKMDKALQEFHVKQVEEKTKIREKNFIQDLEEADLAKKLFESEEQNFNSWAERMIIQWQTEGKDIKPLLKELKQMKNK